MFEVVNKPTKCAYLYKKCLFWPEAHVTMSAKVSDSVKSETQVSSKV